jgi:hypothetical protein
MRKDLSIISEEVISEDIRRRGFKHKIRDDNNIPATAHSRFSSVLSSFDADLEPGKRPPKIPIRDRRTSGEYNLATSSRKRQAMSSSKYL